MIILEPPEYSMMCSRPVEYSIDTFLGDRQVKNRKNRFPRFFQKCSKISVNIEFCLTNTLNTPKGHFLPIFHHISQYKPLEKKQMFFYENHDFCVFFLFFLFDFLNFDDAIDYSAGTGRKCEIWPEMGPLDPQDTSTYLVCYYIMTRTNL